MLQVPVPTTARPPLAASNDGSGIRHKKRSFQQRWESTFGKPHTARWHPRSIVELVRKEGRPLALLMTLGACASILDYTIELGVLALAEGRRALLGVDALQGDDRAAGRFGAWGGFMVVVAGLAMLVTRAIDPTAAGSGIPEMKTIISCDLRKEADDFLGGRTLVAKALGLTLALGSGISVGKEGPFVHTASIIAHRLMKHLGFFQRVFHNDILRRHMYNAACAVGVASTFRAPIGGVLFAIEVTSTIFMLTNYWRAFVASLSASVARQLVSLLRDDEVTAFHPMFPTAFPSKAFTVLEFVAFALLGVLMGIAGAAYVTLSAAFKRRWNARVAAMPLGAALLLLLVTCCLLYLPGPYMRLSYGQTLRDLCSPENLSSIWTGGPAPMLVVLIIAAIVRLVATTLSTSLPLPAGDFIPTFVAGTCLGRLFGELLVITFPSAGIIPGTYALVGGAAFVGSATHTVSVAVIAMEFTGQFVLMTPLILAVLLASGIGSALSVSLYESVIISKGLTYLPLLRVNQLEGIKARDVMAMQFPLLGVETTVEAITELLQGYPQLQVVPVVESNESMLFFGCVSRTDLDNVMLTGKNGVEIGNDSPSSASSPPQTGKENETRVESQTTTELVAVSSNVPERHSAGSPPKKSPSSTLVSRLLGSRSPSRPVDLRQQPGLAIDSSVLQVDSEAPVQTVHLLFEMFKCSRIWVTRRGQLIGLIRRRHMHSRVEELRQARQQQQQQHLV